MCWEKGMEGSTFTRLGQAANNLSMELTGRPGSEYCNDDSGEYVTMHCMRTCYVFFPRGGSDLAD